MSHVPLKFDFHLFISSRSYHCRTTLESPIRLSVPLERPQTQPVYVSPSECQGSCEPEDQQPQRHHPYARSSRRTRSQDGSIESRATKELKKRKCMSRLRHLRLYLFILLSATRSLRRIRVPELASPSASADTPSPTRSEFSSRSSRSPRTPTNGDISDSREDEDILLISYAMDVQRDLTKKGKRKRRDAVTLACYFCRKRKIACKQPEEGSEDKSCGYVLPRFRRFVRRANEPAFVDNAVLVISSANIPPSLDVDYADPPTRRVRHISTRQLVALSFAFTSCISSLSRLVLGCSEIICCPHLVHYLS